MNGAILKIRKRVLVFISPEQKKLIFKGPLGCLELIYPGNLHIQHKRGDKSFLEIAVISESQLYNKALIGTLTSIILRKMVGVEKGFLRFIRIVGVGWHVEVSGQDLIFKLGFSHIVKYKIPANIEVVLIDKQQLKLFSLDLMELTQLISKLCRIRKTDFYKGKGVRLANQAIKLKVSSKVK